MKKILKRVAAVLIAATLLAPAMPAVPTYASSFTADSAPIASTIGAYSFDYTSYSVSGGRAEDACAYTEVGEIKKEIAAAAATYTYVNSAGKTITGTVTPSMCYIYYKGTAGVFKRNQLNRLGLLGTTPTTTTQVVYALDGASIGTMSDTVRVAAGEYTMEVHYGTDNAHGKDFSLNVSPIKSINWPTSLPTTEYLAGIEWKTPDTKLTVTYMNGVTRDYAVTPDMLYLAKTSNSVNGSGDGTVIGYQAAHRYGDTWKNNAGTYRTVIVWNGYNSASRYSDRGDNFALRYDSGGTNLYIGKESEVQPDRLSDSQPTRDSAQGYYEYSYSEFLRKVSYKWGLKGVSASQSYTLYQDFVQNMLANRNGKQSAKVWRKSYNTACFADDVTGGVTGIDGEVTYTTYVINTNGCKFYDVTVYAPSAVLPEVKYSAHVQNIGWQGYFYSPEAAGTDHQSLRMEAIILDMENWHKQLGSIQYQVHVQNKGWMDVTDMKKMAGTEGDSLRMEAIRIQFTGQYKDIYDISYQAHVQTIGWQEWVQNWDEAGTDGQQKRMEALKIQVKIK